MWNYGIQEAWLPLHWLLLVKKHWRNLGAQSYPVIYFVLLDCHQGEQSGVFFWLFSEAIAHLVLTWRPHTGWAWHPWGLCSRNLHRFLCQTKAVKSLGSYLKISCLPWGKGGRWTINRLGATHFPFPGTGKNAKWYCIYLNLTRNFFSQIQSSNQSVH